MKKGVIFLTITLAVSLSANVYLVNLVVDWQEAWTEQILTTAHIERLYTQSGVDVSFETVKKLVADEMGEYDIVPVVPSDKQPLGVDKSAISIDGTKLFFQDGKYIGSKANLPEHLIHWRIGDEF